MRVKTIAIMLLAATGVALAGCRDADRPLTYNKGEYGGKADTELSAEQVEALRQRGMRTYQ